MRNLTRRLPQFSVASLMIVVACCAIGLTIGTSPADEPDSFTASLGFYEPQLNWHYAFFATASCFLIVELWRQQRQLSRRSPSSAEDAAKDGWKWAILARRALIAMLAVLLLCMLLLQQRIIQFDDRDEILYVLTDGIFPQTTWYVAFLIALLVAVPITDSPTGQLRSGIDMAVGWTCGVLLLVFLVSDSQLITYLVHLATAGIDASHSLKSQRLSHFPNHRREGWFTFSMSSAAFAVLLVAAICFIVLCRSSGSKRKRLTAMSLFLLSLGGCGAFGLWFYFNEFQRISPDLASQAANAAIPRDWLGAALIFALVSVVGAFRFGRSHHCTSTVSQSSGADDPILASGMALLAVVPTLISVVLLSIELLRAVLAPGLFGGTSATDLLRYLFSSPLLLLELGISILAIQIAWRWWRHGAPEIVVLRIEPRRVFCAWLGLTALVIVGVPVLAAFGFCWWLGPWYL